MFRFRLSLINLLVMAALVWSCTPSRYVRPLAEGEKAVSGSFGGPFIQNFGAPIPIPFVTVGGAYGLKPQTTAFANIHVTSALFGVGQVDFGVTQGILRPDGWKPGLSASAVANAAVDAYEGRFKLWPQIDANAYWEYGAKKHYAFAGFSTWWEPRAFAHPKEAGIQMVVPGLQVGNTFAGNSWDKSLELKWNNFVKPSEDAVVDWAAFGKLGGLGIQFSITKRF